MCKVSPNQPECATKIITAKLTQHTLSILHQFTQHNQAVTWLELHCLSDFMSLIHFWLFTYSLRTYLSFLHISFVGFSLFSSWSTDWCCCNGLTSCLRTTEHYHFMFTSKTAKWLAAFEFVLPFRLPKAIPFQLLYRHENWFRSTYVWVWFANHTSYVANIKPINLLNYTWRLAIWSYIRMMIHPLTFHVCHFNQNKRSH